MIKKDKNVKKNIKKTFFHANDCYLHERLCLEQKKEKNEKKKKMKKKQ